MGLKRRLKRIGKAIPVIVANEPALADLVRQIKEALKAPESEPDTARPAPAEPAPPAPAA